MTPPTILLGKVDVLLPEELAIGSCETEGATDATSAIGLGEEDLVAPHDWRGVALKGERHLPLHVFLVAPLEGDVLF